MRPAEVESHAQQISQTARETTRSLDEIVWAVNPANDTLDGLVNYACKYAQEYLALAGLRYRADVPAQLPAIPIPPEVRHNVFLAFKEAVNNVVKHAQATEARIRLRLRAGTFHSGDRRQRPRHGQPDAGAAKPKRPAQHAQTDGGHSRRIFHRPAAQWRNDRAPDGADYQSEMNEDLKY